MASDLTTRDTTGLSVYDRISDPMAAVTQMGEFIAKSGMFGCSKPEQGMVLALACMCERKNPIEISRTYHIIDNKLSMRADAMLAGFRAKGGKVQWIVADENKAAGEWSFENKVTKIDFTIEDAKRAGLIRPGSGWVKDPGAMLRARCISKAVRMLCPEVVAGVYTPEEVADFNVEAPPMNEPKVAKAQVVQVQAEIVKPETKIPAVKLVGETKEADGPSSGPSPVPETPKKVEELAKPAAVENPLPTQQQMVAEVLPKNKHAVALEWLVKNNWIKAGESFDKLHNKDCERILAKPDPFLRAIEVGKVLASAAK